MTSQRGDREEASRSGDARDPGHVELAWVAAPGLVRRSRDDAAVEARPHFIEGGALQPRVLLVDENHLLTRSLARWFTHLGCAATVACSCSAACATPGPFDCGVFDVEIGGADGVVLADRLRCAGTIVTAAFYCSSSNGRLLRRASAIGPVVMKDAPMSQLMQAVRVQIEVARNRRVGQGS